MLLFQYVESDFEEYETKCTLFLMLVSMLDVFPCCIPVCLNGTLQIPMNFQYVLVILAELVIRPIFFFRQCLIFLNLFEYLIKFPIQLSFKGKALNKFSCSTLRLI